MTIKDYLATLAILITVIGFLPYIKSIHQGRTKPHVFSWVIWGSTTFMVFLAQLYDAAGAGAWPMGVSGLITLYVAWLAYNRRADITLTKSDCVFLAAALCAMPIWFITDNPLWAVVILTLIDLFGFAPTFRKAYRFPLQEKLLFYNLMAIRNIISIAALENYSATTVLFPAAIAGACGCFVAMVYYRRRVS